jgi:hypothetical protein
VNIDGKEQFPRRERAHDCVGTIYVRFVKTVLYSFSSKKNVKQIEKRTLTSRNRGLIETSIFTLLVKKYPTFYRSRKFYYNIQKNPSLNALFCLMNSVHILKSYFFKVDFDILPHLRMCLQSDLFPPDFLNKTLFYLCFIKKNLNSVALVRKRTIPTERPKLVDEVSANLSGRECCVVSTTDYHGR